MIYLPVNKALVAEELVIDCGNRCNVEPDYKCPTEHCCKGCVALENIIGGYPDNTVCGLLCCFPENREDGKNVIFKLVDVDKIT